MDDLHYIFAGNLIDGSGGSIQRQVFLEVRRGIISAIFPRGEQPEIASSSCIDLSNCTILPPVVDCSVSLRSSGAIGQEDGLLWEHLGPADQASRLAVHAGYFLAHGVLGVVSRDDSSETLAEFRKSSASVQLPAIVCPTHSQAVGNGEGYLRVPFSADIDDPDSQDVSEGEPCSFQRDRIGDLQIVAIANGVEQVRAALLSGCNAIEQGYYMGEDNLRLMAERGVMWIPNVLRAKNGLDSSGSGGDVCCRFSQRYVAPGKALPGMEEFWKTTLKEQLGLLRKARKLGVKVAVGTGAGSTGILLGESVIEEMKLLIKAGFPLVETLQAASTHGAEFFGFDHLGPLLVGRPATFLATQGGANQLPRKLSLLETIFVDGAPCPAYNKLPR